MSIAITLGEPAGIGPDLLIQLAAQTLLDEHVIIADPELLRERAKQLDIPLQINICQPATKTSKTHYDPALHTLNVLPIHCPAPVIAGQLNVDNAHYVLETIKEGVKGCMNGEFSALVTAPLHKGIINDAGHPFTGHTEYLAELTHSRLPVMMLATKGLRVALATTHLPLSEVSTALTRENLSAVIEVLHNDLQSKFGIRHPQLLICGLNPHAGEGGHLGREEIDVIEPVLTTLRQQGMNLIGPLPADTLFTPRYLEKADAVLAMYHDQGLPVLKYMGFGRAVNITLGLPIIRTSVDHGTALDLVGTGAADTGSLQTALTTAVQLVQSTFTPTN